ncbi:hypothetical protein DWV00_10210 [Trinickia dinghuensis]|uniref:Uncharacterized protein n=1 Tax=Trinickia dinghuensis TaxID=2291023 RepID=A0A3D8JZQ5_9BURK|nr:hypothetical protein DWV00_10210 [Trinickia dinghuensis]
MDVLEAHTMCRAVHRSCDETARGDTGREALGQQRRDVVALCGKMGARGGEIAPAYATVRQMALDFHDDTRLAT